ncbi:cyclic nucleotide-binding domain-containing protein [Rhodococcus sp. UNC363MFTsu5.1]|uniref:cyclic nucleotide-binding domain-containing protein n=1 Tax=Rhodococcus sp. UNC363MFTsu5.1 TaxID=1449069 RepID=UPI000488C355|nr:cyclic nucleotide-binding domain-containing protein [Rhodococcus sp. UNC363MFTsu5.1]
MNDFGGTAFPVNFEGLTDRQLHRLAGISRGVQFAAGEEIFREGDPAGKCWFIRSGRVILTATVPGRGEVTVETLSHGDVLGVSWLRAPRLWEWSASAVAATTAVELDVATLESLAQDEPAIGRGVYLTLSRSLLHRLQATRARLLNVYVQEHVQ